MKSSPVNKRENLNWLTNQRNWQNYINDCSLMLLLKIVVWFPVGFFMVSKLSLDWLLSKIIDAIIDIIFTEHFLAIFRHPLFWQMDNLVCTDYFDYFSLWCCFWIWIFVFYYLKSWPLGDINSRLNNIHIHYIIFLKWIILGAIKSSYRCCWHLVI